MKRAALCLLLFAALAAPASAAPRSCGPLVHDKAGGVLRANAHTSCGLARAGWAQLVRLTNSATANGATSFYSGGLHVTSPTTGVTYLVDCRYRATGHLVYACRGARRIYFDIWSKVRVPDAHSSRAPRVSVALARRAANAALARWSKDDGGTGYRVSMCRQHQGAVDCEALEQDALIEGAPTDVGYTVTMRRAHSGVLVSSSLFDTRYFYRI